MSLKVDFRKPVQYELMLGRQATDALREMPVGYLPIGCLERHGDHLPMGLDVIKAHRICCILAQAIGGVVFPPHYYAGVHFLSPEHMQRTTGEWGNLYTDNTARDHLVDILNQMATMGVRVLVLYTGHYPHCQIEMVQDIAEHFREHPTLTVVPFSECLILQGDHAGISETSLMLYLGHDMVDMTQITDVNYCDHGWNETNTPEKASSAKGEEDMRQILEHVERLIQSALHP